jgi:hypothetical protein
MDQRFTKLTKFNITALYAGGGGELQSFLASESLQTIVSKILSDLMIHNNIRNSIIPDKNLVKLKILVKSYLHS